MKTKTLTSFINNTNIPASLIRAVIRQIGGFEQFKGYANDVANHGAQGWVSGFIYCNHTIAFTCKNKAAILALAKRQASDYGEQSAYQMIASFNYLRDEDLSADRIAELLNQPFKNVDNEATSLLNTLAWYALEEVCRAWVKFTEQD